MTDTLAPPERHARQAVLSPGLPAPGEARGHVRAAMRDWDAPVDWDIAVLAAGALVNSAIGRCPDHGVTLAIGLAGGQLRVEVHAPAGDIPAGGNPDAGLAVVGLVSQEWGACRTSRGATLYFTLS